MGKFAAAAPYLLAAGTVLGAAGQIQAGRAAAEASEANALALERQAEQAKKSAEFEEGKLRRQGAFIRAAQRAAFAGSGVTMEGSPLLAAADSAEQEELDALAIRYNARTTEANLRTRAAIERMQGKQAKQAGYIGAATTLLTGGAGTAYLLS